MNRPLRIMLLLVCSLVGFGVLFSRQLPGTVGKGRTSPEVITDQSDYEPGSTAHITGSGFRPKETVGLQVLHADGTPDTGEDHAPWYVAADPHGELVTSWHVCEDDCLGSLLELTAVGQRSGFTAKTRFTDGPSAGEKLEGWFSLARQWGGTIQGVNSKYGEGDSIPLRFTATLAAGSANTVLLKYDFSTGGPQRFFDSLGSYDASDKNANPASGISGLTLTNQWTIPADTSPPPGNLPAGAQIPGFLTAYNVSGLSFGNYTLVNGVKAIPVTFTVASGSGKKSVVFAYGGHLASERNWGSGDGATHFPGASTKAYASLNGNADVNVSVNPAAIVLDTIPPTIQCPGNLLRNTDPGQCSAVINDAALGSATASDNSGVVAISRSGVPAGNVFPAGTTTVTYTATDGDGNTAKCTQTVTVSDTENPASHCPDGLNVNAAAGQCSANVSFAAAPTDNCGVQSIVYTAGATVITSPHVFPVGSTAVSATVQDGAGNTRSCNFTVTVKDAEPPQIVRPADIVQGQCAVVVNYPVPTATDNCPGAITIVCDPPSGSIFPAGKSTVTCTATDAAGNSAKTSFAVTIDDPFNKSWPAALELPLSVSGPASLVASFDQCLTQPGQSRWFKFRVQPGSKALVRLTGLPANYDIVLYKDIAAAFRELNSPQDLVLLNAEFAAEAFSAEAFSAEAFSAEAFSAEAFSAEAFSAEAFSAEAFSAEAFSAEAFSAEAFSAEAFSAEAFSAEAFSAEAFSAEAFSGGAFSAEAFSAEAFSAEAFSAAFSSAQTRSVLGVSAFNGLANETVIKNTWDNSGYFYVRVRGRNGAFNLAPFHVQVQLLTGACGGVSPVLVPLSTTAAAGNYKTIILTDPGRLAGSDATLQSKLAAFAQRPEVRGVIVDVGADARVLAANLQADANPDCPFAKNLVAQAIRDIVRRYRDLNPSLEYIVIVGNDNVIPFFRYPDLALLANENNYVPPVLDNTASQASLRLGQVLGQDAYGSGCELSLKTSTLPIPDLAVGRLVETASEVGGMVDAYLATSDGTVPAPQSALVTGYDFLEDCAREARAQLEAGTGHTADALIADRNLAPALGWTADQLRPFLLGSRHDLIFLAGHFSAVSLLAGDYSTHLLASELLASPVNMDLALVFGPGCHAGYNVVDPHEIPGVTREPDWAQAFARKRMTSVINTGYGYGDTDIVEFGERLYVEFSHQLRAGTGPVAVGKALVQAKQIYLAGTPQLRGIHEKTILQAALYGLPMLKLNLPAGRGAASGDHSIVTSLNPFSANPGQALGLQSADITVTPILAPHTVGLVIPPLNSTVTATYLSGDEGIYSNPGEPVLPLVVRNVTVAGTVLRGVGFTGGTYSDALNNVLPLTGAPVTEIRGVHAPFISDVFYPLQPWSVNYFDGLCNPGADATRLMLAPAQFRSSGPDSMFGTMRQLTSMKFRLYYSSNTQKYPPGDSNGYVPAQAAAPDIAAVSGTVDGGAVRFSIRVLGDPAAGIQDVWVTYTATTVPWFGLWQSEDLIQASGESTLWTGTLTLPAGIAATDVRFMVSAANGVGLVSLKTKLGASYIPGEDSGPAPTTPTTVVLQSPPTPATGKYGTTASFTASLSSNGTPLAGREIVFLIGAQKKRAITDGTGRATASVRLLALPGEYELQASFEGTGDLKPSSASMPFIIGKQDTVLTLGAQSAITPNNAATFFVATLKDALGRPLSEKTVFVVVTGANGTHVVPAITDFAGRVPVSELLLADGTPLPVGAYQVEADFSGDIPRPPLARLTTLEDARYLPSTVSGSLIVKCPLSQGYWKNHVDLWPVSSLTLGTGTYNKAQLINIMNNTTTSDASVILARQLIATLLNLANNSSPIPVSSTIADANRQLDGCTLPCKVNVRSGNGAAMVKNASFLETYNTGGLTPGCTP